jgi:arginyl-tRNA synthetase
LAGALPSSHLFTLALL